MLVGSNTHCNCRLRHINCCTGRHQGGERKTESWVAASIWYLCNFITHCSSLFGHLHCHVSCNSHIQVRRKRLWQRVAQKAFGWINFYFHIHSGDLGLFLRWPLLCAQRWTQNCRLPSICSNLPASNFFFCSPVSPVTWSHMCYF